MSEPHPNRINPINAVNSPHQFSFVSGVTVTRVEPGYAEGVLAVGPDSGNPFGGVHGGALATLMDTVCGCCACSKGGSCVTANCSMEFLRPVTGPSVTCVATPKKLGRSLSVVQGELRNAEGVLVATGTYTFFMLPEEA